MRITKNNTSRFFASIRKDRNGCWIWTKAKNHWGYGVFGLGGRKAGIERVHRFSWVLHFGQIPTGMFVCHKCDVPACCNPSHLFLGTAKDNSRDAVKKGRHKSPPVYYGDENCSRKFPQSQVRGSSVHSAKLTAKAVMEIRKMRENGEIYRVIAEKYKISTCYVWSIVFRKTWDHIP